MSNVKIILVGDSTEGLKHAPLAMWYAKKLRSDGGKHGLQRVFHDGTAMIRVLLDDNTGDKAYIEAGGGCPLVVYNGYLDTFSGLYDSDTSGGRRMIELQEDTENLPRTRNGEAIAGDPKMHGIRKVPVYNSQTDPAPTLPPGQMLSTDRFPLVSVNRDTHDADFRDLFVRYKPSRFSGLMRKVMQCTFGSGAWYGISYMGTSNTDPPMPQRKLRVNFQWNDSWGVVLAPGKDGSRGSHYFLIQIILNTVHWVPADFCVHKVRVDGVVDYAPVLRNVYTTEAVVIGTLPAFGGGSCSKAIGWSFSYTEPKAAAVIFGEAWQGSATFFTSALARVSFGFTDGVPASINATVGHHQILWNHFLTNDNSILATGSGFFNPPDDAGRFNITQDWHPVGSATPGNYSCDATPIHIFFSPDGTEKLITYSYRDMPGTSSSSAPITKAADYFSEGVWTKSVSAYVQWGFDINGAGHIQGGGTESSNTTRYVVREICGPAAPIGSNTTLTYRPSGIWKATYYTPDPDPAPPDTPVFNDPGTNIVSDWLRQQYRWVLATTTVVSGAERIVRSYCTLPVDDIESVVLVQTLSEGAATIDVSYTYTAGADYFGALPLCYNDNVGQPSGDFSERVYATYGCGIISPVKVAFEPADESLWNPYFLITPAQKAYYEGFVYPVTPKIGVISSVTVCGVSYPVLSASGVSAPTAPSEDLSHTDEKDLELRVEVHSHHDKITLPYRGRGWDSALTKVHLNDGFSVTHSSSAFSPTKFFTYESAPSRIVVSMDGEEYNPTNAVTGWIGVA